MLKKSFNPTTAWLIVVAAILGMVLFVIPASAQQTTMTSVTYAEDRKDPVLTLVARDPEGADIVWSTLSELPSPPPEVGGTPLIGSDIEDAADFKVAGGVLTFASSPNYEAPADEGGNNEYNVVVQASDGGLSPRYLNFFKVTVTVTNKDEGGSVALAPTAQADVTLLQPQVGVDITASLTDPDGAPTGTPEWQWYRGPGMSGPWTKIEEDATAATYTPADTAGSSDVGMHLRVVASYTDPEGSGKSAEAVSEYLTLGSVANNTAPSFAEGTATTRAVIEGASPGTPIGDPVTATDADSGEEVTYRLTGDDDDASFRINAKTGQLMVGTVLDFDAAAGTDNQCDTANSCVVTVTAYDSSGEDADDTPPGAAAIEVTISVTGKDEAPSVSGPARLEHIENNTALDTDISTPDAVDAVEYDATVAEEGTALTFSTAGADGDLFGLSPCDNATDTCRTLAFKAGPDYEDPGDSDGDNVYEVTVVVSDGVNTGTQDVTVKVTGVEEDGSIGVTPAQPLVGVELTAELTDSDGVVTGPNWQWRKQVTEQVTDLCPAADAESWDEAATKISGATSATYTPATGDNGACLHVGVTYTDRTFDADDMFNESVELLLPAKVQGAPMNMPPAFSAGTTARYLPEDADENDNVGDVVTAKDANGDALSYTLSGADADSFDIERTSGQITVGADAKLDHETKPRLRVTVTARDPHGTTDTITVMIHVTDVDEAPTIADSQDSMVTTMKAVGKYPEGGTDPVITLVARDPEGADIVWSILMDVQVGGETAQIDGEDVTGDDIANAESFEVVDGVVRFASPPDFGTENDYSVVVQASDGGLSARYANWFKVTVSVTNEEEGGSIALAPTAQNDVKLLQPQVEVGITATLSDPDGDPIGTVEWQWYRTRSRTAAGTKIDGETSNTYTPVDTSGISNVGMYLRVVASYTDPEGSGKSAEAVSQYKTLDNVEDNAAPTFTEGEATTRAVIEGASSGTAIGAPVTATDADSGEQLTYRLTGTDDDGKFSIDAKTGQLMVGTVLDYDAATGDNQCNTANSCEVTVTVYDSSGTSAGAGTDTIAVTISVTGQNEAPSVSGPARLEHVENGTALDTDVSTETVDAAEYNAADQDAGTALTFELSGADGDLFGLGDCAIESDTCRVLAFKAGPDYEDPGDSDGDNVYKVTVVVSDGVSTGMQAVTVKVTGVEEDGSVDVTPAQPRVGVELTAELTDSDGVVTGPSWQWARSDASGGEYTDIDGAKSATYTPVGGDDMMFLRVTATYTDRTFHEDPTPEDSRRFNESVVEVLPADVQRVTTNVAPAFSAETTVRYLPEDATEADDTDLGAAVGAAVTADDANGDELAYTLSGADADSFAIDRTTGQITVAAKAGLDHETKPTLMVTVRARDPHDATDTITVMIHVTNVDEAPTIMEGGLVVSGLTSVDYAEDRTDAVATYTASGTDAAQATWSLSGDDAGDFDISSSGELTFASEPDFEAPADADEDNVYEVTVEADDGTYMDTRAVTITVTNVNDAPEFASATATRSVAENTAAGEDIGDPVAATDDDAGDTLTYTLGGDDADSFDMATSTGQLMTSAELDFETTNSYTVTVTASDGTEEATITVTVMVTDEGPEFASATTTRSVAENTAAGENIGAPVEATGGEGDMLTYSLGGDDADSFDIATSTGQLMTKAELDFETADSHTVTVTASDGTEEATITVTVMVTDVDEELDLMTRYDADGSGDIDKDEAIAAINDYLFGEGDEAISKADAIAVINLYLFGS